MAAPGSVLAPDAPGCRTAKVLYFAKFTSALYSDWTLGGVEAQFATLSMTPAALTPTQPAIAIRFARSLIHFMRFPHAINRTSDGPARRSPAPARIVASRWTVSQA